MTEYLLTRGPYLLYGFLLLTGLWILLSQRNYFKALVGLYLVQSAILLFFIFLSVRRGSTVPIVSPVGTLHNPIPHALMLTAIVVGVATLAVGLSLLLRLQSEQQSIEERDAEEGTP